MPSALATRLVIGLAAAIWFALAVALDAPVDQSWVKPLAIATSIVVGLVLIFDRWLWKWLPVGVTKRPNLQGTWKATLQYQWPEGSPPQSKDCYLVIRQTYSEISINMHFDISDSESRSAAICTTNGRRSLWWSYISVAHALEQDGNPPHRGGADLAIAMKPRLSLVGDYWTERKTRGRIVTTGHTRQCHDTFASAASAKYS